MKEKSYYYTIYTYDSCITPLYKGNELLSSG